MLSNLLLLYPEYSTWYGPTFHQDEGRYYIFLYNNETKRRTTISYAKALIQCKLNRLLTDDEEVDHIDNDKQNDNLDNLQVLTKEENRLKQSKRKYVEVTCAYCGLVFKKLAYRVKQRSKFINGNVFYCDRACFAKSKRR